MPHDVLLLRANTNLWESQEERTATELASIVVYADGLVIAHIDPYRARAQRRAIQLTPEELEVVQRTIATARPQERQLSNLGCACHTIVIQARATDGELVEISAAGGVTPWDPDHPPHPEVEPWMLELDGLLNHIYFLAEHRKEVPTTRVVPEVPAGEFVEG